MLLCIWVSLTAAAGHCLELACTICADACGYVLSLCHVLLSAICAFARRDLKSLLTTERSSNISKDTMAHYSPWHLLENFCQMDVPVTQILMTAVATVKVHRIGQLVSTSTSDSTVALELLILAGND